MSRGRGICRKEQSPPSPTLSSLSESNLEKSPNQSQASCDQRTTMQSFVSDRVGVGRGKTRSNASSVWRVSTLSSADFLSKHDRCHLRETQQCGKIGERIRVLVNYFKLLNVQHLLDTVYQYHVDISSNHDVELSFTRKRAIYSSWIKTLPSAMHNSLAFDNDSIVISSEKLPDIDQKGVKYPIPALNRWGKQELFNFIIKLIESNQGRIDLKDLEIDRLIQILTIVLHEAISKNAYTIQRRSFYTISTKENTFNLGLGKVGWRGFYSAVVLSANEPKLALNLDVNHTIFTKKQTFLKFLHELIWKHSIDNNKELDKKMCELCDTLSRDKNRIDYINEQIKGMKIRYKNAQIICVYTVNSLGKSAKEQEFSDSSGTLIKVEEHYQNHYNLLLTYPQLPVLSILKKDRWIYLPMELCDVEPVCVKKMTPDQVKNLCDNASQPPDVYFKNVMNVRNKEFDFNDDPILTAWRLNVDSQMLLSEARILPEPIVQYEKFDVRNFREPGVWTMENCVKYDSPAVFPQVWAMINMSYKNLSKNDVKEFCVELRRRAFNHGIKTFCLPAIYQECDTNSVIEYIQRLMDENHDCKFIYFVFPEYNVELYRLVKSFCEYQVGIITGCIIGKNVRKNTHRGREVFNAPVIEQLLLKINSKLNGINSRLKVDPGIETFFSRGHRIMYVGIDLSYPGPGLLDTGRRATVAVCASVDDIPYRYAKQLRVQYYPAKMENGQSLEMIVDLKDIMKSLIKSYHDLRQYPPNAIIIYRDGISEGEFDTIFSYELDSIRHACVELSDAYRPYITYVIVQKRHHTRFFTESNNRHGYDNVVAGTVVDSPNVISTSTNNFYLNSHGPLKGTNRPSHYHLMYDDNNLTADNIQMLTYALCYTYARCTRSISIPAVVKYADILAGRAALYSKELQYVVLNLT
ncbi:unnamed protein product [Didymodactylos carnosus]|uniref:Uncharacterized protein n=1 Tax=Didymodactylos carnosus TaxID=1234261 RepID=A0A813PCG8_9BILA|nr:unnamed protein product [Didymodactylos carnosus]CAF3527665.1 unnamed protein product [Didymodactylos carnosus]